MVSDAIHHALQAGYARCAARLIAQNWVQTAYRGELATILSWLDALPERTLAESAYLNTIYAWMLFLKGDLPGVVPYLARAESLNDDNVQVQVAALRSYTARLLDGDLTAAIAYGERALSAASDDDIVLRGVVQLNLGYTWLAQDDKSQAVEHLQAGVETLLPTGNYLALGNALLHLADLVEDVDRVERQCRSLLARAAGLACLPALGLIHLALATAAYRLGDYENTEIYLTTGLDLCEKGGYADALRRGYLLLAGWRLHHGDREGATAAAGEALRLAQSIDAPHIEQATTAQVNALFAGRAQSSTVDALTERELEILRLIARGLSNQEIADTLVIALQTVKKHTSHIYGKLGVTSRTQAAARAHELGLL